MKSLSPKEQLEFLKIPCEEIVSEDQLLKMLEKSQETKTPLRVKAGFDPSSPDLHLGHTVLIQLMKRFQVLGHQVIFLIGDFTAMIGDPTGKNQTRPPLSKEQIAENAKTYADQVFKILDPKLTEVRYNSEWFDKFTATDFIRLSSQYTLARMLERDDFEKRYKAKQPIALHEFLYPLVQGQDSVELKADVELGGTDQKFNLLVGRDLQKSAEQRPQVILTVPLLEGTDGVKKMSKSLNNAISIDESPKEMFGKMMSITDPMMFKYFMLLTNKTATEIAELHNQVEKGTSHPKDLKLKLALTIVTQFHGAIAAEKAQVEFENIFKKGGLPDDIPDLQYQPGEKNFVDVLNELGLVGSKGEARRLIQGGGFKFENEKVMDPQFKQNFELNKKYLLQLGKKKFAYLNVNGDAHEG